MALVKKQDKPKLQNLLKKLDRDLEEASRQMTSPLPCSEDDLIDITIIVKELRNLRQRVQEALRTF